MKELLLYATYMKEQGAVKVYAQCPLQILALLVMISKMDLKKSWQHLTLENSEKNKPLI